MATKDDAPESGKGQVDNTTLKRTTEVLTAIAAASTLFYALGLVFLAAQLWWSYRLDFANVWYAATLVPLKVVLGQGVRVLLNTATISILSVILLTGVTFRFLAPGIRAKVRAEFPARPELLDIPDVPDLPISEKLWFPPSYGLEAVLKVHKKLTIAQENVDALDAHLEKALQTRPKGIRWIIFRSSRGTIAVWIVLFCLLVALGVANYDSRGWEGVGRFVIGQIGGGVAGLPLFAALAAEHTTNRLPLWIRLARAIVAIYASVFILAVMQGKLSDPPLPPIAIALEGGRDVRGRLLNHADGNWHVITDTGDILAIPDSKSGIVTMPKRPGTPTASTPGPQRSATPIGSP